MTLLQQNQEIHADAQKKVQEMHESAAAGDMPVALMHDGPSLGGFVCPATITSSTLWKMGQCRAGDGIVFKPTTLSKHPACCC